MASGFLYSLLIISVAFHLIIDDTDEKGGVCLVLAIALRNRSGIQHLWILAHSKYGHVEFRFLRDQRPLCQIDFRHAATCQADAASGGGK